MKTPRFGLPVPLGSEPSMEDVMVGLAVELVIKAALEVQLARVREQVEGVLHPRVPGFGTVFDGAIAGANDALWDAIRDCAELLPPRAER